MTFNVNSLDIREKYTSYEEINDFIGNTLWAWGYNIATYPVIGDNTIISKSFPVQTVAGGTNWKSVSVGCHGNHAAAIKTDGTLWLWGYNSYGQLGDNTRTNKSSPVQTVSGGTNWKQVSRGSDHTAAIKTDGTLWVWGSNYKGKLGTDSTYSYRSSPVLTAAGGSNWKQVACSSGTTTAVKTDGTLWLWGWNNNGQLGDNTVVDKSSPIQTVAGGTNWKQVSCGEYHTAAIKTDGSLWVWGMGSALGTNTAVLRSSPVQTAAGGTNWKQVSCGGVHTAAIKTNGTLWVWGIGDQGQLGDNTAISKSSPIQTVSAGTNWKQVSCGFYTTAAIKTDGTLWLWGQGYNGELGDNLPTNKSSPVQTVAGGTNWKQVSMAQYSAIAITYTDLQ